MGYRQTAQFSQAVEANSGQEEKKSLKGNMSKVKYTQLSPILAAFTEGQKEGTRRFDSIDGRFSQLTLRQDVQQKDIEFLKKEVEKIKAGDISSEGNKSSGRGSFACVSGLRTSPNEATRLESQFDLPVTKRRVIAVGGFHEDMAPEQLKEVMERAYIQAGDQGMAGDG